MGVPNSAPQDTITLPPEMTTASAQGGGGAHEVDLSNEWESMMADEAPAAAPAGPSDADRLADEIAGHLAAGRISEASLSLEMFRALASDDPRLTAFQARIDQAQAAATRTAATSVSPTEWPAPTPPMPMAAPEAP